LIDQLEMERLTGRLEHAAVPFEVAPQRVWVRDPSRNHIAFSIKENAS
jgi:hypothetical protein